MVVGVRVLGNWLPYLGLIWGGRLRRRAKKLARSERVLCPGLGIVIAPCDPALPPGKILLLRLQKKLGPRSRFQKQPSGMLAPLDARAATLGSGMHQLRPFGTANLAKHLANGTSTVIFQTVWSRLQFAMPFSSPLSIGTIMPFGNAWVQHVPKCLWF